MRTYEHADTARAAYLRRHSVWDIAEVTVAIIAASLTLAMLAEAAFQIITAAR